MAPPSGCPRTLPRPAAPAQSAATAQPTAGRHPGTYAALGRKALATLEGGYYDGAGQWNMCVPLRCVAGNRDWGADSLTYVLYLHWLLTRDPVVAPIMNALTAPPTSPHAQRDQRRPAVGLGRRRTRVPDHPQPRGPAQGGGVFRLRRRLATVRGRRLLRHLVPALLRRQHPAQDAGDRCQLRQGGRAALPGHAGQHSYLTQARSGLPAVRQVLPEPRCLAVHRLRVRQRDLLHPGARAVLRLGERPDDLERVTPWPSSPGDGPTSAEAIATARTVTRIWATPPASTPTCRPRTTSPSR